MTETEDYDKSATPTAHKTTHQDGGDDEVNVDGLSGELEDEQDAGKIKGKTVPSPVLSDDEKALTYDHDTGQFKYVAPAQVSDLAYGPAWDGVTAIAGSKNAIYDEIELRLKAAAVISDNKLIRGDGGVRGAQETTMIVDDNGIMRNPSQPSFFCKVTSDDLNVTGDITPYSLDNSPWTKIFDQGNNFTGGHFTAPISGRYYFNGVLAARGLLAAHTYFKWQLYTSNRLLYLVYLDPHNILESGFVMLTFSVFVEMDTSDTAYLVFTVSGGTKVVDVSAYTYFCGVSVC